MNKVAIQFIAILGCAIQISQAGPEVSTLDPKAVVIDEMGKAVVMEKPCPWYISAGATVRAISADFRQDGHDQVLIDWRRQLHLKHDKGDVGFFKGGKIVHYDDGSVGPREGDTGAAYASVDSASQQHYTGREFLDFPILAFDFHTTEHHAFTDSNVVHSSDSDTGVGPYIQVGYQLCGIENFVVNLVTGWSFVSTDHASGTQQVADVAVTETVYTYTYDNSWLVGQPGFPFVSYPGGVGNSGLASVNYNNALWTGPGGKIPGDNGRDPRKSVSTSTIARFFATSTSHLDVDLNEIPFGIEIGRQVGPVELFLTVGATLNVINYELENQVNWYRVGKASPVQKHQWRDSGTPIKVGLYGGLTARCPLTDNGRFYFEGSGSYRWVDPVHAAAGIADVEIDVSSWEGRLGFGIILD